MQTSPTSTPHLPVNAFGASIPSIAQIANDAQMGPIIESTLTTVLSCLGIDHQRPELIARITEAARWSDRNKDYERDVHGMLSETGVLARIPEALLGRSALIRDQIEPFVKSGRLADIGCGDGRVGRLLSRPELEVALCDLYQHPNISGTELVFSKLTQLGALPYGSGSFDTALVLTVFHHSDDPLTVLREVSRILRPNGRLIVIESVFGIEGLPNGLERTAENLAFVQLSCEQQRWLNIFFDHFYNRIVHYSIDPTTKVNVPFNFNTPDEWRRAFEGVGLSQSTMIHLGIDQLVVPEYHTLHICDKKEL